jgi:hypothetical protein
MIKASETRIIMDTFNSQVYQQMVDKAKAICDNEISQEIERLANKGKSRASVTLPTNIDIDIVEQYRISNGYTVTVLTNSYIIIEW